MILLLSGGLDSIAMWRLLKCNAVTFNLGTKPSNKELESLLWATDHFGFSYYQTRELDMRVHEADNGYVPFRNSILILAAAQLDPDVAIGQIAEWAPDKNKRFYRRLEKTVNVEGKMAQFEGGLRISAPYAHLSKGALIREYGAKFGFAEMETLLRRTWSCYLDGEIHCGRCGGCGQRFNAECHAARLLALPINTLLSRYEVIPEFVPTPLVDQARWVRDNGLLGVRQLRERRDQNWSARFYHQHHGSDLRAG